MARAKPRVALGLQGGGSYGAYGWGVIDRLLEERIEVVAVSGASAGALNGAALVAGLAAGGEAGARDALERLWRTTADLSPLRGFEVFGPYAPFFDLFLDPIVARSLAVFREASAYVSPFLPALRDMQLFRSVIGRSLDLGPIAREEGVPLYVSATDILTGAARLFAGAEVTLEALMASCCLPELFAPVEIGGRRYWDGGYAANPALEPLVFNGHGASDLIVVQLTPFEAAAVGTMPSEITARVSDISFNACLMRDLKTLTELHLYARETATNDPRMRALAAIDIHLLQAPCALAGGGVSKLDTRWSTICGLRDLGRETAERWLAETGHGIGADQLAGAVA